MPMRGKFPEWKKILANTRRKACKGRIVVNGKRLVELMQTIMSACPDAGEYNPVWIEFGSRNDALFVRALNTQTGQYALGMVNPLDVSGHWLRTGDWEKRMLGDGVRTVKRVK